MYQEPADGDEMNMEITIRKADIWDLDAVTDIFKKAVQVMNENNILQWDEIYPDREVLTEDIRKGEMYLGVIKDEIASVFVVNDEFEEQYNDGKWNYRESTFAILHRLCVNPLFQNKGVGCKTLSLMEKMLKELGIEAVRLDAFSQNPYALRMYEKLGYIKTGEVNFRKGLFYLYEKKIK